MNCKQCEYVAYTQEGHPECGIAKCPIVLRDEILEEAAQVAEELARKGWAQGTINLGMIAKELRGMKSDSQK